MVLAIIIVLFLSVSVHNWHTLLKNAGTLEKVVWFSFASVSFVILVLRSFDIKVPSPAVPIQKVIETVFKSIKDL